jgi:hypothetical protein
MDYDFWNDYGAEGLGSKDECLFVIVQLLSIES